MPYEAYVSLSEKLFDAGITASIYLGTKKFGKQIEYAVKENYSHVIIMGGDELSAGQVKIKDLLTREEKTVAIEEMGSAI